VSNKKNIKLLLAYDGSGLAMDAVHYIADAFPCDRTQVVIFYVETKIPRSFWRMEKELDFRFQTPEIRASMATRKKEVNLAMAKAKAILIDSGFPTDAVINKIYTKNQGIVPDIVEESHQGYDALILGRKGHSKIKDFLLDSVPIRLMGKIKNIPLIVVGGKSSHKNILVAFDGTREVIKAVIHMSCMINKSGCKLSLCHSQQADTLFSKNEKKDPSELFDLSKGYFLDAGFSMNQLSCEIIADEKNPATCILDKAKDGDYGTIVVGRRGLTAFKNILLKRVGDKIFKNADNHVVWIVQ